MQLTVKEARQLEKEENCLKLLMHLFTTCDKGYTKYDFDKNIRAFKVNYHIKRALISNNFIAEMKDRKNHLWWKSSQYPNREMAKKLVVQIDNVLGIIKANKTLNSQHATIIASKNLVPIINNPVAATVPKPTLGGKTNDRYKAFYEELNAVGATSFWREIAKKNHIGNEGLLWLQKENFLTQGEKQETGGKFRRSYQFAKQLTENDIERMKLEVKTKMYASIKNKQTNTPLSETLLSVTPIAIAKEVKVNAVEKPEVNDTSKTKNTKQEDIDFAKLLFQLGDKASATEILSKLV